MKNLIASAQVVEESLLEDDLRPMLGKVGDLMESTEKQVCHILDFILIELKASL